MCVCVCNVATTHTCTHAHTHTHTNALSFRFGRLTHQPQQPQPQQPQQPPSPRRALSEQVAGAWDDYLRYHRAGGNFTAFTAEATRKVVARAVEAIGACLSSVLLVERRTLPTKHSLTV